MPKKNRFVLHNITFRALWRRKLACALLTAIMALGAFSSIVLHYQTQKQEQALAKMIEESEIFCVVTDIHGTRTDNLRMLSMYVDRLMGLRHETGCYLDQYVKNVQAKSTQSLESPKDCTLIRILGFESDMALLPANGASITLFDGWTEDVFLTKNTVCLVPGDMLPEAGPDGNMVISVQWEEQPAIELTVIGTIQNGPRNTIYCPFYMQTNPNESVMLYVDNCTFLIGDNARLDECKTAIYETFLNPLQPITEGAFRNSVLIHDEVYLNTKEEIESNIRMFHLLLPILTALCGLIGFFASYLATRGRLKEFAVMRCLGLRQRRIFGLVFEEFLLLALVGGIAGITGGYILDGTLEPAALLKAILLVCAFLLGAAIATLHMTRVSVMKLMKVED